MKERRWCKDRNQSLPSPLSSLLQGALPHWALPDCETSLLLGAHHRGGGGRQGRRKGRGDTDRKSERTKKANGRSEVERDLRSWARGQGGLEVKGKLKEGWKPALSRSEF